MSYGTIFFTMGTIILLYIGIKFIQWLDIEIDIRLMRYRYQSEDEIARYKQKAIAKWTPYWLRDSVWDDI